MENQPERNLWSAVIDRVIDDLKLDTDNKIPKRTREMNIYLKNQAKTWFNSYKVKEGSFEWICSILGFDSDGIRDQLGNNLTGYNSSDNDYCYGKKACIKRED